MLAFRPAVLDVRTIGGGFLFCLAFLRHIRVPAAAGASGPVSTTHRRVECAVIHHSQLPPISKCPAIPCCVFLNSMAGLTKGTNCNAMCLCSLSCRVIPLTSIKIDNGTMGWVVFPCASAWFLPHGNATFFWVRSMVLYVFSVAPKDHQIFWAIVSGIPIDVMNHLSRAKRPAQHSLCYHSMLVASMELGVSSRFAVSFVLLLSPPDRITLILRPHGACHRFPTLMTAKYMVMYFRRRSSDDLAADFAFHLNHTRPSLHCSRMSAIQSRIVRLPG